MSRRLVSRRYAKALLQIGLQQGILLPLQEDLKHLRALVEDHGDLRRLVTHPLFGPSAKAEAFDAVLARAGASDLVRHFFDVVARNARLDHFFDILDAFDALVDEYEGVLEARITSAQPLTEAQAQTLLASLATRTGRKVRPRWLTDPSILGGLQVQVGSTVYDASILGQLHQFRHRMFSASSQ